MIYDYRDHYQHITVDDQNSRERIEVTQEQPFCTRVSAKMATVYVRNIASLDHVEVNLGHTEIWLTFDQARKLCDLLKDTQL